LDNTPPPRSTPLDLIILSPAIPTDAISLVTAYVELPTTLLPVMSSGVTYPMKYLPVLVEGDSVTVITYKTSGFLDVNLLYSS
jgi:hypothetical protein